MEGDRGPGGPVHCPARRQIVRYDGAHVITDLTARSFTKGQLSFWTKSDSVSYFADTSIVYTPKEPLAAALVRQMLKKYPRLLGLKIFATTINRKELHVVASEDA